MEVRKCVEMARNNAVHQGLSGQGLIVSGYVIGRGSDIQKRIDIKGKGRYGIRERKKAHLEVFVAPLATLRGARWVGRRQQLAMAERYQSWRRGEPAAAQSKAEEQ